MDTTESTAAPSREPEFVRRAARAWIRAADAGIIDAAELGWLLEQLAPGAVVPALRKFVVGTVR